MKTLYRGSGCELEVGQVGRESSDLQGYALNLQPAVLHTAGTHSSHTFACCQTEKGKRERREDLRVAPKKQL